MSPACRIVALADKALILGRRGRVGHPLRHLAIGPVVLVDRPLAFGVEQGDHAAQLVMDQDAGLAIDPPNLGVGIGDDLLVRPSPKLRISIGPKYAVVVCCAVPARSMRNSRLPSAA
jgi:hypothetical protein